jgi:hypothetical protein
MHGATVPGQSRGGGRGRRLTSYWVRSLSATSARKWLALTTQRAPTVPNPGRRQSSSPLLLDAAGGSASATMTAPLEAGTGICLSRACSPRRGALAPELHFLTPAFGGRASAAALGCAKLLCSGCFRGTPGRPWPPRPRSPPPPSPALPTTVHGTSSTSSIAPDLAAARREPHSRKKGTQPPRDQAGRKLDRKRPNGKKAKIYLACINADRTARRDHRAGGETFELDAP